jgi:hypothetical protein
MKKVLILCACLAATGCAGLQFQWSASYATQDLAAAMKDAQQKPPAIPAGLTK